MQIGGAFGNAVDSYFQLSEFMISRGNFIFSSSSTVGNCQIVQGIGNGLAHCLRCVDNYALYNGACVLSKNCETYASIYSAN